MRLTHTSLAHSALIVAAAFAVSRVLGMLREVVIAARFGTGETYDAYIAAFRIPDLLFVIVMSGAFGSAFIPIFGGFLARGDEKRAWRLANALLTWTVVILLLGLGAAAKGMLEAQDMFTLPAVAPIVYNVGIILGALLLSPAMGIYGLCKVPEVTTVVAKVQARVGRGAPPS